MSYVEMTIDSLRHAMHKDEWVILLKDRAGQRYLPVYVDKACGDMIAKIMMNEACEEIIDIDIEGRIKHMWDTGSEVVLMIDDAGVGVYKARFVGRGCDVECGVGKGLVMATKASMSIWVRKEFAMLLDQFKSSV